MRSSRSGIPTWTCIPKMSSSRMTSCISSSRVRYRSCSVTSWSCHIANGCVPAEPSRRSDYARKEARVPRRRKISSRASSTLEQILVPTSQGHREPFPRNAHGLLDHVGLGQRCLQGLLPLVLVHRPPQHHALPAVLVVGLQDQPVAVLCHPGRQVVDALGAVGGGLGR